MTSGCPVLSEVCFSWSVRRDVLGWTGSARLHNGQEVHVTGRGPSEALETLCAAVAAVVGGV